MSILSVKSFFAVARTFWTSRARAAGASSAVALGVLLLLAPLAHAQADGAAPNRGSAQGRGPGQGRGGPGQGRGPARGPSNAEVQAIYADQLKNTPDPVPGIPEPILLWPEGAPGAVPDANGVFTDEDKPAVYAFPAPANNNTGAALLILPGGAFTNRCADNEGVQVARFLNRHGISGFVLRYRIQPNYRNNISVLDANRAIRYIRAHAAEYKISADRVGTIGFSAGAELEGDAFFNGVVDGDPTSADKLDWFSTRPNFIVLIYGGRTPREPAKAPPTFMFNTIEDGGHLNAEVPAWNALRNAGVATEVHFYNYGEHGTSMSPGDPLLGEWPDLMVGWLKTSGFLTDKAAAASGTACSAAVKLLLFARELAGKSRTRI